MRYSTRIAKPDDVLAIRRIYNQGIEDRVATFEVRLRSEEEMQDWLLQRSDKHKVVVIEDESEKILGWSSLNLFNSRCCYGSIADISIYIEREMRGKGLGKVLLNSLIEAAREQGFHKLVLNAFAFNSAGLGLYKALGFREVGTYIKQGMLDGKWVDVTIMEMLLI